MATKLKEAPRTPTEKASEPALGRALLPKERYLSEDFMRLEWERMWTKVWLMGCREEEIAQVGDYITTEIGVESILIVRGEDGVARAFYNVCNHRGNQVKFDKCGNAKTLQCAYHYWEYGLDGTLLNVPDEEDFPQGCPRDRLSLKMLPCDVWGGWVWFSLNPDAEPLADYLGMIPEHLDAYHFTDLALTSTVTVEWDCNWKVSVDAFNEIYHTHVIHPELSFQHDDINIQIDLYDKHSRYLIPFQVPSPRVIDHVDDVPEIIAEQMRVIGMDPDTFKGRIGEVRRAFQETMRAHGQKTGIDFTDLSDDQLSDDYHYFIFPNITFNIFADWVLVFRQRPHPSDPNKMFFDLSTIHRFPEGAERPPLPDHEQFPHGDRSLGLVLDQDSVNVPHIQKGMHSSGYEGLWISHQERRVRHMHATLMGYIEGNA